MTFVNDRFGTPTFVGDLIVYIVPHTHELARAIVSKITRTGATVVNENGDKTSRGSHQFVKMNNEK